MGLGCWAGLPSPCTPQTLTKRAKHPGRTIGLSCLASTVRCTSMKRRDTAATSSSLLPCRKEAGQGGAAASGGVGEQQREGVRGALLQEAHAHAVTLRPRRSAVAHPSQPPSPLLSHLRWPRSPPGASPAAAPPPAGLHPGTSAAAEGREQVGGCLGFSRAGQAWVAAAGWGHSASRAAPAHSWHSGPCPLPAAAAPAPPAARTARSRSRRPSRSPCGCSAPPPRLWGRPARTSCSGEHGPWRGEALPQTLPGAGHSPPAPHACQLRRACRQQGAGAAGCTHRRRRAMALGRLSSRAW